MKILEAQSAILTNYEVYSYLKEQQATYKATGKRRGPSNYETVVKELMDYLRAPPSPLGDKKLPYDEKTIETLLTQLRPYEFTKAEILMIMNHRPTKVAALDTIVQELSDRIPDEAEQGRVVDIIQQVLGSPDAAAQREEMSSAAQKGRDHDAQTREHVTSESGAEGT